MVYKQEARALKPEAQHNIETEFVYCANKALDCPDCLDKILRCPDVS